MDNALKQLIKISNNVGKDSLLIQGGGGNTSVKTDDQNSMFIKASGTAIKDMNAKKGFRRLNLAPVRSIVMDKKIAKLDVYPREIEVVKRLLLACNDNLKTIARPSVESHLHSYLDKCVIHIHPAAVLSYACAKDGKKLLEKLFIKQKPRPLWIPYADPGYMLGRKITKAVLNYRNQFGKNPHVCFLQKHGLIISADNPELTLKLLQTVINKCSSKLKPLKCKKIKPPDQKTITNTKRNIRKAVEKVTNTKTLITYFTNDTISAFMQREDAKKLLSVPAITPDEQLYNHGPAMWLESFNPGIIAEKLSAQIEKSRKLSVAFLVRDVGLFVAAKKKITPAIKEIAENSFFIRVNALRMGGLMHLNLRQQNFINNWEADVFRKKVATGTEKI